jgi:hypothetical protein
MSNRDEQKQQTIYEPRLDCLGKLLQRLGEQLPGQRIIGADGQGRMEALNRVLHLPGELEGVSHCAVCAGLAGVEG